eukprot:5853703-Pyramimonas_sp.AAC.2
MAAPRLSMGKRKRKSRGMQLLSRSAHRAALGHLERAPAHGKAERVWPQRKELQEGMRRDARRLGQRRTTSTTLCPDDSM